MKNIALLLATLFLGSCHQYWRNADRFQSELKCGQSAEQIIALASKHGAEKHWMRTDDIREGAPRLYVRDGSTVFSFWLSDEKLEAFRQGKYYGISGVRTSLRMNLCTGERTGHPMLYVTAPEELKGASLALDGKAFARLSTGDGPADLASGVRELHLGQHEIEITKDGFSPIRRQFTYTSKGFWPPREIRITIEPGEVRRLPR
jgi:hypothetical protein